MASISDVRLQIFERSGSALIQVSYKITGTQNLVRRGGLVITPV
jgi:hypothetical protein